jgi:hypothetical protein
MKIQFIVVLIALVAASAANASDPFGVGASGGALLPVVQEDQGTGYLLGIRFRLGLHGPFIMEPNIHFGSYGDAEIEGIGSRKGASLKHYGIDVTLGNPIARLGFKPFLFLGGAIYNTKKDGDNTTNKSGWSFGGGVALGIRPELDIDIRGRFNIAGSEGSASKKSIGLTIGVTYYFGLK